MTGFTSEVEFPEVPDLFIIELDNGTQRKYQQPQEDFRIENVGGGLIKVHVYDDPGFSEKLYADTFSLDEVVFTRVSVASDSEQDCAQLAQSCPAP